MNAHPVTQIPVADSVTKSRRTGGLRRKLAVLVAALVLPLTASAAFAQPAAAAGGVSYCFRHTNNSAYTYDAYLQLWYNGQWNTVWNAGRSVNGCKSVTISGWWQSYPARMLAFTQVGSYRYVGTTPYWAPAGSGGYNLGTGYVNI